LTGSRSLTDYFDRLIYKIITWIPGPEFGGAIGLMFFLANSIAVSMYLIGFCESLLDCMKQYGGIQVVQSIVLALRAQFYKTMFAFFPFYENYYFKFH
jgi:solute carrier family 12 sodium/potassium/chloride transporter 2